MLFYHVTWLKITVSNECERFISIIKLSGRYFIIRESRNSLSGSWNSRYHGDVCVGMTHIH